MESNEQPIRTRAVPRCGLCGAPGTPLHRGLKDRLFGVEGTWGFDRCSNAACELIWLNPMPLEEEFGRLYSVYYHSLDAVTARTGGDFRVRLLRRCWQIWAWLTTADRFQRHVERIRPAGRFLDVGCGQGDRLARMRALGWAVEGVEPDRRSAAVAREKHGLTVHNTTLEAAGLPEGRFDLVVLAHVIEHVHDPVGLLRECRRVLRDGGILRAATPNAQGYGARTFGADWFGWEPPRHLYLFSPRTLELVARKASFGNTVVKAIPGPNTLFSALASLDIRRSGRHVPGAIPGFRAAMAVPVHQLRQAVRFRLSPAWGDELQLEATNDAVVRSVVHI